MRDIIYRGKRKDNGEWVYGVPLKEGYSQEVEMIWYEYSSLAYTERVQVLPETVGQYTGLNDKNGKKIFEGDIARCFGEAGDEHIVVIEWRQERAMFVLKTIEKEPFDLYIDSSDFFVLLGNIHDNPKLLEGDNDNL